MTPEEERFLRSLQARAGFTGKRVQPRLFAAWNVIRRSVSERELTRAIERGEVEALINLLLSDDQLDPAMSSLRRLVQQEALRSTESWRREIPSSIRAGMFDTLNPRVVEAIRDLDTRVMRGIKDEIRDTARQVAQAGLEQGVNPRVTARHLRDTIGLAPNQEAAVVNFRRMLEAGDREALTRKLRNRQFDKTLDRALGKNGTGLTREQIEVMSAEYQKGMIRFNSETHARSMAIDAQKAAQVASWENSIQQGWVDPADLTVEWMATGGKEGDGRTRLAHRELHGARRSWYGTYPNGDRIPGQSEYNCRCGQRVLYKAKALRLAA